jgi:hypothetical protein
MSKSNLVDILKGDTLQTLNDGKFKRFALRRDQYSNSFDAAAEAIGKVYSDELADDGQDEYQARCLAAIADPTNKIIGEVDGSEKNSSFLVRVIARIPKLHASIPKPDEELCQIQRNMAILMHPEFYALQSDGSVPQPGNLIKVKFFTDGQGAYGEYLGIIDANTIAVTDMPESAKEAYNENVAESTVEEATQNGNG